MKNTIVFKIVGLFLLLSAGLRLALWAVYGDYFADVNVQAALGQGARFDSKLVVLALSPFLLLLLLPFGKLNQARFRRACAWFCWLIISLLLGLGVADIAYFGEVQRHIGSDLLNIAGDIGFIVQTAFGTRWLYTLCGAIALAACTFWWRKWIVQAALPVSGSVWQRIASSTLTLILLILAARGWVLSGKPLNSVDAFMGNGQAQANLTLNGVLVTLDAVRERQQQQPLVYVDNATAQAFAQRYPQPFSYQSKQPASGRNIVFILLESWSYRYIDALAGGHYRATPHMDKLIAQSQVWDNFYAAGQRSIVGIQAALTSVPALPNRQPLGFGLELNNMSRIAELAGKQGYRTLMAQSSKRRSFHMDGIARALGFQEYYGQEDVPLRRTYPQDIPPYGWDYDTLQFLGQQISQQPARPFFAFLFTGTTHEPFANAGAEFALYPHDAKGENGFLNALAYSDWAVHEFMQYAAKQTWYRNTIFVFTADHTLNSGKQPATVRERFHIPLIVFDPQNPNPVRHSQLASQYDLLPTFADWLGIAQPVSTFGRSLLNPNSEIVPLMLNQGSRTASILPNGDTAEFEGKNALSGEPKSLQWLQWRMQQADKLLRDNAWVI